MKKTLAPNDVVVIVRTGPSLEDQFGTLCRRAEALGMDEEQISDLLLKDEDAADPFRSLREAVNAAGGTDDDNASPATTKPSFTP